MPLLKLRFNIFYLVLITNLLCIVYLILKSTLLIISAINANGFDFEFKDTYFKVVINSSISRNIKVIPMPKSISYENSILLLKSNNFRIISKQNNSNDLKLAINRYSKYIALLIEDSTNTNKKTMSSENTLIIDCPSIHSVTDKYYPKLGDDESYAFNIKKSGMYLYALSFTGVLRGLSTFIQLIERDISSQKSYVPLISIIDQPRFPWRGFMLDVSRHWMPVSVIERTLNAMELSKLNVLHLHLSDDQGFRVESLEHKALHDRKNYFTQKDIHHLVEYARQRRIRIIPEFDMPGHTTSWFVGYPELAVEPGPYKVAIEWGVMKSTMDPSAESTYTFLDSFFKEMSKLFPDRYFHIGGDEVEGSQWQKSGVIQRFIDKHKLKNKNGLQAYFNKRIQTMLKKYGKIMIGWEEIMDEVSGNLTVDKDAVIQVWKDRKTLKNIINRGYRGILSKDYYLDSLSPSIYHYQVDPIHDNQSQLLNEEQQNRILGGEACMWAEMVSKHTVDSRIWPRLIAIAERLWSPSSIDNQQTLYERLFRMNHLLDKIQINLTHVSFYKQRLQNLISKPNQSLSVVDQLTILADVCEPTGYHERYKIGRRTSTFPLTTFTDALQSESELIWKLENLSINDKNLREIFQIWSVNRLRLKNLINSSDNSENLQLWGQDIEKLSKNLAQVGRIGLNILDYNNKKIFHVYYNKTNSTNSQTLSNWIFYHRNILDQLEYQVQEIRLAAVRPVRRLLISLQ